MNELTVQLPAGWTRRTPTATEAEQGILLFASDERTDLVVRVAPVHDPRRTIPERIRDRAGDSGAPVATTYLELPSGRALLAHAVDHAVAELWLPLVGTGQALVLTVTAAVDEWAEQVAELVSGIANRLHFGESAPRAGAPVLAAR